MLTGSLIMARNYAVRSLLGVMLINRFVSTNGAFYSHSKNHHILGPDSLVMRSGPCHHQRHSTFYYSTTENGDKSPTQMTTAMRKTALHEQLEALGIDSKELHKAALQSIQSPSDGYDIRFGKSGIRAYRSFVNPKRQPIKCSDIEAIAAAARCARQVDFLIKRHKSREAEWIRHTDTATSRRIFPLVLVLDNVRSAFNVGSLFRTADACGCTEVITTGITPHPNGSGADKLTKSALGADRLVPHRHFDTTLQAIQTLKQQDQRTSWKLVGMETTSKSILYTEMDYPETGTVLVLGNEVTGVDTDILPLLDGVVEIPMFGAKNSLNIAACAPVVLYEVLRQWGAMEQSPGAESRHN